MARASQFMGIDFSHMDSCYAAFAFQMTWTWLLVLVPIGWGTRRGKNLYYWRYTTQYHSIAILRLFPRSFHSYTGHPQLYIPGAPQTLLPSSSLVLSVSVQEPNCIVTCWGDVNKSLSIPDRTLTTGQSQDRSQVYLGELVSSRNLLTECG